MWRGKGAAGTARVGWQGTRRVSNSEDRVVGVGEREGVSKEIEGAFGVEGGAEDGLSERSWQCKNFIERRGCW